MSTYMGESARERVRIFLRFFLIFQVILPSNRQLNCSDQRSVRAHFEDSEGRLLADVRNPDADAFPTVSQWVGGWVGVGGWVCGCGWWCLCASV
jgi:hypothetical protein